jgi:undecaprenyl-diphosphatase
MNVIQAIILAIIEGLTEFMPVSSTGHMIIGSTAMGIASDPFVKVFTVAIQFGAILAVLVLYWRRFLQNFDFYVKLFIGFLPALAAGLLLKKYVDRLLESIVTVGISLLLGGIVLVLLDRYFERKRKLDTSIEDVSWLKALKIGAFQVIAMVPGVSRSAATIIGGLTQGLSPTTAAEFSFFLAVPTMFAATAKSLLDYFTEEGGSISGQEWILLAVGNVVAFVVALLAIRSFIGYLTKHGFKIFGYYRIFVGVCILLLWWLGYFDGVQTGNF